jgi:protein phosphatase
MNCGEHINKNMSTKTDPIQLRAFGLTDVGCVREANEDAFSISEQHGLFIVSDGIGGSQAGALASAMTVQALPVQVSAEQFARNIGEQSEAQSAIAAGLVRAIGLVNDMLLDKTRDHPEVKGFGATVVTGLYAENGVLALAHLGDSRCYLMRDGFLERLTTDHTVAEMLFQAGRITKQQLHKHPSRHVLTRHIGKEDCQPADVSLLLLQPGDRVLFCTDGLTGMLKNREIGTILWDTEDRESACRLLIDHAKKAGGTDNITVVIVDVTEPNAQQKNRRLKVVVRRKIGRSLSAPKYEQKQEEKEILSF